MAIADDLHIKWRTTNDIQCLHYLAATLYVKNQQPRPPFDKNDLSYKEPLFRNLPMSELLHRTGFPRMQSIWQRNSQ